MSLHINLILYYVFVTAGSFSKPQIMNIHTFSLLRMWLERTVPDSGYETQPLFGAVQEYCNILVEQCFRPAHKEHDIALQKAVSRMYNTLEISAVCIIPLTCFYTASYLLE
jgi:hypothetical protein